MSEQQTPQQLSLAKELQLSAIKILNGLFDEEAPQQISLQDGRVVECKTAKVKHLKEIVALMEAMLSGVDQTYFVRLIDKISDKQAAIIKGESDQPLDLMATIREIAGQGSLILKLTASGMDLLTKIIPMFSNLTEAEVEDLDIQQVTLVAFGVLSKNYQFFSQQVLPSFLACIGHLRMKNSNQQAEQKN